MYQNHSVGYAADPSTNYAQQQQQYYNYYYQQQQYPPQGGVGVQHSGNGQQQYQATQSDVSYPSYNQSTPPYSQSPVPPVSTANHTPAPQTQGEKQPDQSPVVPSTEETNIEEVDMEMDNEEERESGSPVVANNVPVASSQEEQTQATEKVTKETNSEEISTSQYATNQTYSNTAPQSQVGPVQTETTASTWSAPQNQQSAAPLPPPPVPTAQQWYPSQQGGVANWGGAQSGWSNYSGNWQQQGAWSPQQQYQQQQGQWGGRGWDQWAGQGGGASGGAGQWGQWQGQQPQTGVEAWAGQSYGMYQPQQAYGYPQSYSNSQQQQQPAHYQGAPTQTLAAPHPDTRRSRSPGTPPLPDPVPPEGQGAVPASPYSQGGGAGGGGAPQGRKHPRSSEEAGGNSDAKRAHTDGRDQPRPPTAANNNRGYGGRGRSRWEQQNKDGVVNGSTPPASILPLPTPNMPPRDYSLPHHQQMQQPTGEIPNKAHQQQQQSKDAPVPASKGNMPPTMKEYVNRAFLSARSEEEREAIHKHLDVKLNKIFAESLQWSMDWDKEPLPLEEINKKPASRWDTPSPSMELHTSRSRGPPQYSPSPSVTHQGGGSGQGVRGDLDDEGWVGGFGRGRGKRKKKNKKRGKNNKFFIDTQPGVGMASMPTQVDKAKINHRIDRFGKQGVTENRKKLSIDDLLKTVTLNSVSDQIYWQDSSVEGTSQALEKRYLRLTSAPDPSMVRPQPVLKLSLKHVCEKWQANKDYHYACEQFKSIRQDLTIQGVRNEFTVDVYETHARVALENNDREEFNQCQTQLMSLYNEKEPGCYPNQPEFIAYRILYLILTMNTADMSTILLELTPNLKTSPCIEHAQKLCSAWLLGNYAQFFRLYRTAPLMCGALVNIFIERERKSAFKTMTKAMEERQSGWSDVKTQQKVMMLQIMYRPNLSVSCITHTLAFDSDEDCLAFLSSVDAVLDASRLNVDCKLSLAKLNAAPTS